MFDGQFTRISKFIGSHSVGSGILISIMFAASAAAAVTSGMVAKEVKVGGDQKLIKKANGSVALSSIAAVGSGLLIAYALLKAPRVYFAC